MQGVKSKIWRCKLLTKREMCRCKVLVSKMWQCKMQVFSWFFVFPGIRTYHGTNAGRTTSTSMSSPLWGLTEKRLLYTDKRIRWTILLLFFCLEEPLRWDRETRVFTCFLHSKSFARPKKMHTQFLCEHVRTHRNLYTHTHTKRFTHRRLYKQKFCK